MQTDLLTKAEIKCLFCQTILKQCKFNALALERAVEDAVAGLANADDISPQDQCAPEDKGDAGTPDPQSFDIPAASVPQPKKPETVEEEDEDVDTIVNKYKPFIELLPAGTAGKRVPYRCVVCKTRHQPFGKIGELDEYKPKSVRYFLNQHCKGPTHMKNVEKWNNPIEREDTMVPCEGISTGCVETGGKLFLHSAEFDLWARMADLQAFAKHSYTHCANTGHWTVRSKDCEGTTKLADDMIRQACGGCLALGAAHSVPWPQ